MEIMLALLSVVWGQTANLVRVTPSELDALSEPQVAVENDGHIYVASGDGNAIYVSRSSDSGSTFSAPIKVAEAGRMSLGMRRGPRIAAYQGRLTITATYGAKGGGADGDILTFRSTDQGKTWSAGANVNDVGGAAREGLHAMAVAPDGTLACSWLDLRSKGTKLYMSTSKDGGKSWAKNQLVYESPAGFICQCCHPSLAYEPNGTLLLMYRNVLEGARDMYLTQTSDDGKTFTPVSKLGKGTWMLDACPMDGGMVMVDSTRPIGTVWRRENTVYFATPNVPETKLGTGKQPWAAMGPGGMYAVWMGSDGIHCWSPTMKGTQLVSTGNDPVVSSSPDHKIVFAAWTSGGIQGILLAR